MFKKILVANRGEIACRVMRTARKMDIRTVAVYSDADARTPHVALADEAVHIGPSPSAQSYLAVDRILDAVRQTGADAVHPGYGFLSENAAFAKAVEDAGAVFIGPSPSAIAAMGDKIESKKLAAAAGVTTIPGTMDVIEDPDEAVRVARDIGYPVMIKAAAGGGGKGMRVAYDDEEAREGFGLARSEAASSFSDDRVFIEKFIENPRHIEMQILADRHGNTIHLFERECSIQRRNQKVIEEAPSPLLDATTRKLMGEQSIALAEAVGYHSVGTVEFVADPDRNFYFLEMNTRLQVEHRVTEMITGVDLVEQMIRVAAGEKLSMAQSDVSIDGWAMESRIYAEDPFNGFLPSTGRLVRYIPPKKAPGVRLETGVMEGSEISRFYDPMIAKLCTWGETREAAISRMCQSLNGFYIQGVSHNVPFCSAIMLNERFRAGDLTTKFIDQEYPDGFEVSSLPPTDPHLLTAAAAAIQVRMTEREATISGQLAGHEATVGHNWIVVVNDEQHAVRVLPSEGGYDVSLLGELMHVTTEWTPDQPIFKAQVDGRAVIVQIQWERVGFRLFSTGAVADVLVLSPRAAELYQHMPVKQAPDMSQFLLSPMPGMLVSLHVKEGEAVRAGQMLAIIEAMKMENVLRADHDATVERILAEPGENLSLNKPIIEFAAE
jgi:propionyl-CoA carboxylase alpha subunit